MKTTFTLEEVIELLVKNNNAIIKLIDTSKYYKIENGEVVTYKKGFFSDKKIKITSFEEVVQQIESAK